MAELNKYQLFSLISINEKSFQDIERSSSANKGNSRKPDVRNMLNEFSNIRTIKKAKRYLKDNFDITDDINDFSIEQNCLLNVKNHDCFFEVRVKLNKENYIYCYKK